MSYLVLQILTSRQLDLFLITTNLSNPDLYNLICLGTWYFKPYLANIIL